MNYFRKLRVLLVLCPGLSVGCIHAHFDYSIMLEGSGYVRDVNTGDGIRNVSVQLYENYRLIKNRDVQPVQLCMTDRDGKIAFRYDLWWGENKPARYKHSILKRTLVVLLFEKQGYSSVLLEYEIPLAATDAEPHIIALDTIFMNKNNGENRGSVWNIGPK